MIREAATAQGLRTDRSLIQGAGPEDGAAQRRRVTPDVLGRVADVYNATPAGGRLEAVQAAFGVSERTALRYTKQIKEKGMVHG